MNAQLPDKNTDEQGAGHAAQHELADRQLADQIAQRDRHKHRQKRSGIKDPVD